jgi:hypothetical protein
VHEEPPEDDDRSWWLALVAKTFAQAKGRPLPDEVLLPLFDELYRHYAKPDAWMVFDEVVPLLTHLHALGWTGSPSMPAASTTLRRNDLELRLHRSLLRATTTDGLDDDLRTGLVPTSAPGGTTFVPAPAELLLTILVDGLLARPAGSIDWIIDAHRLITDSPELDWERLRVLTTTYGFDAPVHTALELLDQLSDHDLPVEALALIDTITVTEPQRAAFDRAMTRP